MNKKEFSVYLHKPYLIDKHAEIALQEVVTDFPYFHAAHQLLLKAHQNNGSYHFEKQLPVVSLLHGNRALLYAYLKDSIVREFTEVAQEDPALAEELYHEIKIPSEENLLVTGELLVDESNVIPSLDWKITNSQLDDDEISEKDEVPETTVPVDLSIEEETPVITFRKSENDDTSLPFQNYEQKYLHHIKFDFNNEEQPVDENIIPYVEPIKTNEIVEDISNNDLPFQNFEEKYLSNKLPESKEKEVPAVNSKIDEPISIEQEMIASPMTKDEVKVISTIEPQDFLNWLQSKRSVSKEAKTQIKEDNNFAESQITEHADSNKEIITTEEKKIKKFNALIDKFIENSPSISKPQPAKFYNPVLKAKESVTENFDLVSETLAKIYIKQSNYKKAILVYEKLSLLYPEKISYFAARISELQTLLNK